VRNTVKNIRMCTDILRRVFRTSTEPVSYTFVSVNRRNDEARADTAMWARALPFRRGKDTEPVPIKSGKLAAKYPCTYEYFFYSERQLLAQVRTLLFAR